MNGAKHETPIWYTKIINLLCIKKYKKHKMSIIQYDNSLGIKLE